MGAGGLQSPAGCAVLWGQWLLHQLPLSLAVLQLGEVLMPQKSGFAVSPIGEQPPCVTVALGSLDVRNSEH